jgi:hypothetical protein
MRLDRAVCAGPTVGSGTVAPTRRITVPSNDETSDREPTPLGED